ncbi:hypothetical protein BO83DRAFT_375418 [Aspergillus eucalypticola CBS 122712]|uniref:Uncharacterized protein n=1 Tax=Aspergillus eucalypticola (strain CBS 122712 / IBT 29274) TaxID=1448314 RepID=A0A317W868_ASPEC|nr:uncharacterized protein BO83DRAFT_375418 [Aspergillus eucalypticola CBS 122712]PWY81208.1 hypothetical protein BO83DRAFT_375418 [Aspergillus eucalypticola CBS 122712]
MHGQPSPSRVTTDWDTLEDCQPISELTEDPADHHHPPILYPFGILAAGPRTHHHHHHHHHHLYQLLLSTDRIPHSSQAIRPN